MQPWLDPARLQADQPRLIAVTRQEPSPRITEAHHHSRGQLLGAHSGLLSVSLDDGQWTVPATHAVWIPPNQRHGLRSHGPFAGWSLYLSGSLCADLPARTRTLKVSGLLHEAIKRTLETRQRDPDERQRHLEAVILDEIRHTAAEPLGLPLPRDPRLLRITQAQLANLADNRRLADWAHWAGLSSRTLSRRFTAETGFGFGQWRQRARLLRALEQLARGEAVTRIALDLGYDTPSAFIAMFQRQLGTTPGRYRTLST